MPTQKLNLSQVQITEATIALQQLGLHMVRRSPRPVIRWVDADKEGRIKAICFLSGTSQKAPFNEPQEMTVTFTQPRRFKMPSIT